MPDAKLSTIFIVTRLLMCTSQINMKGILVFACYLQWRDVVTKTLPDVFGKASFFKWCGEHMLLREIIMRAMINLYGKGKFAPTAQGDNNIS